MDIARAVSVAPGVDLTNSQIRNINRHVEFYGIGLGAVFIHCMTKSDVDQKSMVNILSPTSLLVLCLLFWTCSCCC